MSGCCVYGCSNRNSQQGLKFYRIPRGSRPFQSHRRRLWLQAIKREDWTEDTIKNARICGAHFISGEASLDWQSPDFVPSIFVYTKQSQRPEAKMERYRRKRRRDEGASNPPVQLGPVDTAEEQGEYSMEQCQAQENFPVPRNEYDDLNLRHRQLQDEYVNLQQERDKLRAENKKLKEEVEKSTFSYATVKSNIGKLIFFTGLTPVMFQWVLAKISGSVERISQKLTHEDHLLLVLIKLRLGLSNIDLAYRFDVSKTTISNICRSWIPAMAVILKTLIKWPSKGVILKNMPEIFKRNFKRCRCIIGCIEIFIARPSNLTTRAQSNYKHNTIKYFIGITPAGAISFLSLGWGGQVSDKQIIMESDFLKLLEPKDEVLADQGFLIRDELAAHGVTLRIPLFTKGKKQLSANEVATSRQLSNVRIHVEQVIGWWKSFKILQTTIPLSHVNMLDDIVVVCGALTNLCKTVLPK